MPRPSGKAAISLKGNAKNLPDIQLSHMAYQEHFKDVYTEDEIRKLLARPKTNKFNEYRTWVIVSVFLGTGIRSLELRSIRCKDVNLNEGYITLIHTKNKEPRVVPLSESLIIILQEYIVFYQKKFDDNVRRYATVKAELQKQNMKQLIVWECAIQRMQKNKSEENSILAAIVSFLLPDERSREIK